MKRPLKRLIDKSLARYLPKAQAEPKSLHRAMRYSVFPGGKRIRPAILIESAVFCGGRIANAMPAACAIELVHTYSLIHDDLPAMDDDDYRRGKPSCHKVFGQACAILAGDALLTLAFGIIARSYMPNLCVSIVKELSQAIGTSGMVGGQALDIEMHRGIKHRKRKTLVDNLKTAKLFEASAKIGAIAAGADTKKVSAMARYGSYLGMAFQIIDDILDGEPGYSAEDAAIAVKKAKKAVKVFGKKAKRLDEISDLILARTK